MSFFLRASCVLLTLFACCHAVADETDVKFVVAGYLPDYRVTAWSEETGSLTDLIFFGMSVSADGKFTEANVSPEHLKKMRKVAKTSGCRLLFTVGGWNKSDGFPLLASTPMLRKEFIQKARDFCIRNGFNGIDYDWEHPDGAQQMRSLSILLQETSAEFHAHNLIVTIAQASWQQLNRSAYESVDRVHLMSYDHEFPQATFKKSKADVERLVSAGCPRNKIVLGLPFYGRNAAGAAKTYAELVEQELPEGSRSQVNGFAYNGPELIVQKVRYAQREKLGGVMIWEIAQDAQGDRSLLSKLKQEVSR